jgi:hypothetical protein
MTDAKRIAKLEAQVAALRARLDARTTQLTLVLLQISDMKAANGTGLTQQQGAPGLGAG